MVAKPGALLQWIGLRMIVCEWNIYNLGGPEDRGERVSKLQFEDTPL